MIENLEICPCKKSDLELLEQSMPSGGNSRFHEKRFQNQEEKGDLYLIAWLGDEPVGGVLITFNGPAEDLVRNKGYKDPVLTGLFVKNEYRGHGIATQLIERSEGIIFEKGFKQSCLAVGVANTPAKKLYEKLGYKDWGKGEYEISWDAINEKGETIKQDELCMLLYKDLK